MPVPILLAGGSLLLLVYLTTNIYLNLIHSPLSKIPGPKLFALTKWRLAYEDFLGTRTRTMQRLHEQYGDAVRIGPSEVSFNSLSALRSIYGAGTVFQRDTGFYRMFDVYGRRVMFSFGGGREHRDRKKLLNHAYSKTSILSPRNATMIEEKARKFLTLVESEALDGNLEIFAALHYFSLDTITAFLYGKSKSKSSSSGATSALDSPSSSQHRHLLDDILHPARRTLSWFTIHLPSLTSWLYAQSGLIESLLSSLHLLPMNKPSTYSSIRAHALLAVEHLLHINNKSESEPLDPSASIAARLFSKLEAAQMDHLDVAGECADHLLAGIDTTSDTLMWAIFALSQPENRIFQEKLRAEILALELDNSSDHTITNQGIIRAAAAEKLPYLDAVIKETLRLFAPLPGTEPRVAENDEVVDGFRIPGGTVVTMSPYTLHRNGRVFRDVGRFNPDRWLAEEEEEKEQVAEMKRWFWAFSSGGRMCIGMHLAMAEMTTLLASVYRTYKTEIRPGFEGVSPGVTARYEVFYDDRFSRVKEHVCWVKFVNALPVSS